MSEREVLSAPSTILAAGAVCYAACAAAAAQHSAVHWYQAIQPCEPLLLPPRLTAGWPCRPWQQAQMSMQLTGHPLQPAYCTALTQRTARAQLQLLAVLASAAAQLQQHAAGACTPPASHKVA
jgi:hypothetical protein